MENVTRVNESIVEDHTEESYELIIETSDGDTIHEELINITNTKNTILETIDSTDKIVKSVKIGIQSREWKDGNPGEWKDEYTINVAPEEILPLRIKDYLVFLKDSFLFDSQTIDIDKDMTREELIELVEGDFGEINKKDVSGLLLIGRINGTTSEEDALDKASLKFNINKNLITLMEI